MRDYGLSPRAVEKLADLHATDSELQAIEFAVAELAAKPKSGYLLPFQSPKNLRRYDVGRFALIYQFNEKRLDVVTVVG
jgi:mRNA-degrading endonuclease RelE of RelBE toxin-antitoxin system